MSFILALGFFWSVFKPGLYLPWVSWQADFVLLIAVLATASWGAVRRLRMRDEAAVAVPRMAWPFLLLAGWVLLQLAVGEVRYLGDAGVFIAFFALCVVCLSLGYGAPPEAATKALAITMVLAGALSTVVAFAQVFDLWPEQDWIVRLPTLRRPGGNMAQPNHLATLLLMAMASLVHLLTIRRLGGLAAALLWVLLSAGLAMTESRTGLLGLGVLLPWWLAKRSALTPGRSPWWGAGALALAALVFVAWPSVYEAVYLMGEGEVQGRLAEGSLRWTVWPQLVQAMLMRPWWGWGAGNVAEAHNAVAHAYAVSEPYTYSHNLILDLALWFGIPAALGLAGVTVVWLWRRLRAANDAISWYALAVALPVGVHAMFEFPHAYAYFLVPVMLALGVLEGRLGGRPLFRLGPRPVAGLLLVMTGLMLWSAVEYLRIEEDFRVARFEALRIGQTPADHERPRVLLLTQLGALVDSTRIKPRPGMPQDELALLKQMALRHPWTATQYRYALALALNGQGEEAERQLQVMRAQHGERIQRQMREQLQQRLAEHALAQQPLRRP